MVDVAIIADDLTGAADSGVQLVRAAYRTAVLFLGASEPSEEVDAVVVDANSRTLAPHNARERVFEVTRGFRDARIVYKKLDSTLRGPVAAELEAALEATGRAQAVVAPAFPNNGRTTREGVQLVNCTPIDKTDLADDPLTPVREAHIPSVLAAGGLENIFTLSTSELSDHGMVRRVLEDVRWLVADADSDAHLKTLVEAVPDPSEVLWAGSAGLVRAIGEVYPGPRTKGSLVAPPPACCNAIVVVGSANEVTREQVRRLASEPKVVPVPLDSLAAAAEFGNAVGKALAAARTALNEGQSIVLHSTVNEERRTNHAKCVVDALAEVVAVLADEGLFDGLVLTGGDTAVSVSRRLEANGILLEDEVEPGMPVGTLIGPRSYRVVTKAGGFGSSDALLHALHALGIFGGSERTHT